MTTAAMPGPVADVSAPGNAITAKTVAVVLAADVLSKAMAVNWLTGQFVPLIRPFRLALLYNDAYTSVPLLHVAAIERTAVVVFVLALVTLKMGGALRRVDRLAPTTLGLLLGAGIANLADMLFGRAGVIDFIAVDRGAVTTVFNLADVAVAVGLVCCVRTATLLSAAALRERRAFARPVASRLSEREVPLLVQYDGLRPRVSDLVRSPARRDDERPTAP